VGRGDLEGRELWFVLRGFSGAWKVGAACLRVDVVDVQTVAGGGHWGQRGGRGAPWVLMKWGRGWEVQANGASKRIAREHAGGIVIVIIPRNNHRSSRSGSSKQQSCGCNTRHHRFTSRATDTRLCLDYVELKKASF